MLRGAADVDHRHLLVSRIALSVSPYGVSGTGADAAAPPVLDIDSANRQQQSDIQDASVACVPKYVHVLVVPRCRHLDTDSRTLRELRAAPLDQVALGVCTCRPRFRWLSSSSQPHKGRQGHLDLELQLQISIHSAIGDLGYECPVWCV